MLSTTRDESRRHRWIVAGLVGLACCIWLPRVARGDSGDHVRIEASGEARSDEASARSNAIDDAFARALEELLSDELTRAEMRRYAKPIRERIVRRARLYVVAFAVDEESSVEGVLRVRVSAQIDRAKVLAALEEIGIRERTARPAGRARQPVALLLHATLVGQSHATFGAGGGDGGVAGRQFADELREQGFHLVDATGSSAPVSSETSSGIPVDDEGAAALAHKLGAGGAFVVGIVLSGQAPVRGTRLSGAEVDAHVRVVTESGKAIARADVRGAGYGQTAEEAAAAAARDAVERAVSAVLPAASRYWPSPRISDDATVVAIRDAPAWTAIEAVIAQLRSARGVSSVGIRHVRSGEVVLAVDTTLPARQLVAVVGAARFEGGSIAATSRSPGLIEATVQQAAGSE